MHPNIIYSNPTITAPRFLFVTIHDVDHHANSCTIIQFRLQPDTLDTEYIYSRLAHTPKAERMWAQCRTTFLFKDYDVRSVIGRVGKIYLVPSAWSNLSFSTAQYVKQTPRDLEKSVTLEAAMRQKAAEAERNDAKADRNKDLLREALTEGGEKGLVQRELF